MTDKGYNDLKEFTKDFNLYLAARENEPEPRRKTNITKILKKDLDRKLQHATQRFKNLMRERGYTRQDLELIATHTHLGFIHEPEEFLALAYNKSPITLEDYKRLVRSQAFKDGSLRSLYKFIPYNVDGPKSLKRFITKLDGQGIDIDQMTSLLDVIAPPQWQEWLEQLEEEGVQVHRRRRWLR